MGQPTDGAPLAATLEIEHGESSANRDNNNIDASPTATKTVNITNSHSHSNGVMVSLFGPDQRG